MALNWSATKEEFEIICKIADRMEDVAQAHIPINRMDFMMDVEAVHCNGCPLDLKKWLETPKTFNFWHDVAGITRHINRKTGRLKDCFVPRFAA